MASSVLVAAADIARMAGVTRATVSNWRRRHDDFPPAAGGTESRPLYDLAVVQRWLKSRDLDQTAQPREMLQTAVRSRPETATAAIPLVRHLVGQDTRDLDRWTALADEPLAARATATGPGSFTRADAPLLRALLAAVQSDGPLACLDMLTKGELEGAAGAYLTPEPLAKLMAALLQPAQGEYPAQVHDPACGSGSLLAAAAEQGATELYGQDVLPIQVERTAVRLKVVAPGASLHTAIGDSLRDDSFPGQEADAVVTNPPFGTRDWGHDELALDPRMAFGLPPKGESELAWLQHVIAHLKPGASGAVLLPPAMASRNSGRRIRAELLRAGAVQAVLALPPGAAAPLHIGLHVWIVKRPDTAALSYTKVLLADLAFSRSAPLNWDALTDDALRAWHDFRDGHGCLPAYTAAIPPINLIDDLVDLTPARHVSGARPASPGEVTKRAADLAANLEQTLATFQQAATFDVITGAGTEPREWRDLTIADLARGGAVTILRASRTAATGAGESTGSRRVLTGENIAAGTAAKPLNNGKIPKAIPLEEGDIVLSKVTRPGMRNPVRVIGQEDAGALLHGSMIAFRPDSTRLDPWFLAGFLSAEDNIAAASTGSSVIQVNPGRLRVPLLPLEEQIRYGCVFRGLHDLRGAAAQAAKAATAAADHIERGLINGALLPSEPAPLDHDDTYAQSCKRP